MKFSLLAAIFAGVILPGSASAGDTPASPGTIVGKEVGIVVVPSNHSVDETVDRLKNILQSKQITLFGADRSQRRSGKGDLADIEPLAGNVGFWG